MKCALVANIIVVKLAEKMVQISHAKKTDFIRIVSIPRVQTKENRVWHLR